ncbi:UDP-N-acetylmuramoyl-L-alanyl-D-glutamate--2,6-diaminopimelate ligase [Radiobacillus sp. PE A8.2]|uniref:UDP-N-acetylmuramoyl-L-alanyl-D-glutamate--2, 6-diaminopimelate ligase n=1 Tax=Radiobacillus sp. PE A8.2 TaxID=3380349 RepID=UPI00388EBE9E
MILTDIATALQYYKLSGNIDRIDVTGVEKDSTKVKNGDLFICIKGYRVDGHDFAKQAEANGAVAIIAEKSLDVNIPVIIVSDTTRALAIIANKFYNYPTHNLQLVGVTGTNGKTTVSYLLEQIFRTHQQKTGLIGTIQMKIGDETFPVQNTTPDALELQRVFRKMQDNKVETAIMEVSSHALALGRVHGCEFNIAIFTNLSQDHLDFHSDMGDYLHAKSLLFSQLGGSYDKENPKYAVINADDPSSALLIKSTAQQVLTYGIESDADIRATNIKLDANGCQFNLHIFDEQILITSKLMGRFSVYNLLAAAGGAVCAGVPLTTFKQSIEQISGVNGRFEPVNLGQSYGVIVDYAHTPDSLENVLQTISSFATGKTYVVVGCGGDRDKTKRPLMAKVASDNADLAIITSDNPRSEDPQVIVKDMVTGIEKENYEIILDRKQAIDYAIGLAKGDDIVLIAGKGHETYQILNDKTIDFDDREVAAEAIQKVSKE